MILATAKELRSSIITALEWDEREQFSTRSSSRLSSVLGCFSHFWHDISCQQIHETWSNEPNVSTLHVGDPQDGFFPARWMITVCQKQRPNCKAHSRVLTPWSRWFWVVPPEVGWKWCGNVGKIETLMNIITYQVQVLCDVQRKFSWETSDIRTTSQ